MARKGADLSIVLTETVLPKDMTVEGPIKYARSGDVYLAYRVFGDGPRDIVLVPGTIAHVELLWEMPGNEHLLKRLTAFDARFGS